MTGRRRKIRCVWPAVKIQQQDGSPRCSNCAARKQQCVPQSTAPTADRTTARDRIARLESQVAALRSPASDSHRSTEPQEPLINSPNVGLDQDGDETSNSVAADVASRSHRKPLLTNISTDSTALQSTRTNSTLRQFASFDTRSARARLQSSLPMASEVAKLENHASSWMSTYHALFPGCTPFHTAEDLVSSYNGIKDPECPLTALAAFLLYADITVQHMSPETVGDVFSESFKPVALKDFVVKEFILSNTEITTTVEGLKVYLLMLNS